MEWKNIKVGTIFYAGKTIADGTRMFFTFIRYKGEYSVKFQKCQVSKNSVVWAESRLDLKEEWNKNKSDYIEANSGILRGTIVLLFGD